MILVLGHTGMVGHMVWRYLHEHGYKVGFADYRLPSDTPTLTYTLNSYDVVINCIGSLVGQSEAHKDNAVYLNAYLPHLISENCKRLIHISTDCVFDDTFYGRSKALGEVDNDKDVTLRMSLIGPDTRPQGQGLFNWYMQQDGPIDGYTGALWNGITTLELCKVIERVLEEDVTGIYSPLLAEYISKRDMLQLFNKIFGRKVEVKSVYKGQNKVLTETRSDFDYEVLDLIQQLKEMKGWIDEHNELYQHYSK